MQLSNHWIWASFGDLCEGFSSREAKSLHDLEHCISFLQR